jgi:hypothetical protein
VLIGRPPGDHVEDVRGRREVLQGAAQPPRRVGSVAGGGVAALIPRPPPRRSVGVGVAPEARGAEREDVPRRVVERDEALDLAEGGVEGPAPAVWPSELVPRVSPPSLASSGCR